MTHWVKTDLPLRIESLHRLHRIVQTEKNIYPPSNNSPHKPLFISLIYSPSKNKDTLKTRVNTMNKSPKGRSFAKPKASAPGINKKITCAEGTAGMNVTPWMKP